MHPIRTLRPLAAAAATEGHDAITAAPEEALAHLRNERSVPLTEKRRDWTGRTGGNIPACQGWKTTDGSKLRTGRNPARGCNDCDDSARDDRRGAFRTGL